jgi:hypothetical protein
MKARVGRQPILDRQRRTVAHELLFRSGAAEGAAAGLSVQARAWADEMARRPAQGRGRAGQWLL